MSQDVFYIIVSVCMIIITLATLIVFGGLLMIGKKINKTINLLNHASAKALGTVFKVTSSIGNIIKFFD